MKDSEQNDAGESRSARYLLYVRDGCPYCARVLDFARAHGVTLALKEKREPGVVDELIARGGTQQFPYLVDRERGEELYESEDIIAYLAHQLGVQPSGEAPGRVCPIEE